ncbi:MAG TPA: acetyltransferase [Sulfurospirillum sp. UBA12182]|nr:MAG TPA: acetyltransferase [Sulfurospirillum sp. UBA12182]
MIWNAIANKLTSFFPESRFFKTKNFIYRVLCKFEIHPSVRMFSSFNIVGVENIQIGQDTFLGHESLIMGANNTKVVIGDFVDISSRVSVITGTHEVDLSGRHIAGKGTGKDIFIDNGAWIGFGSIILPGVKIGKKSIVAAGSIVINDVPDFCMVAGNPAVIKKYLK